MQVKFNLITDTNKKIPVDSISAAPLFKDGVLETIAQEPPLQPRRVMFRGEFVGQEEILALFEGIKITGHYKHLRAKEVTIIGGRFEMEHIFHKYKPMMSEDTINVEFKVV